MPKDPFNPPEAVEFETTRRQVLGGDASPHHHESAVLVFDDWRGRTCRVYAERLVPRGTGGLPAVLHCVGGAQQVTYEDQAYWAGQGYACATFDWQIGEMTGRPPEKTSRWPDGVVVQHAPHASVEQAVLPLALQAARATLSWLASHPAVDENRLGMSGISWGGYLTWLAAAYDKRIRAICPAFGCGIFGPEQSPRPHAPEVTDFWKEHWDPMALASYQTAPAAYFSGSNDFFGDVREADRLLSRLPVDHRWTLLPNADHSVDAGAGRLAGAWMARHLKDKAGIPETPVLGTDLKIRADTSAPVRSREIWWTSSSTQPRFACWNRAPVGASARMAFAKVTYKDGLSLCSRLLVLEGSERAGPLPATWPDLRNGTGWRWELGGTQYYGNEVRITPIEDGQRLNITPAPGRSGHAAALLLHQINDRRWKPSKGEHLCFKWEQETRPGEMTAFLLKRVEGFDFEHAVSCPMIDGQYQIRLPDGFEWENVLDIRIQAGGERRPFTFGPLCKNAGDRKAQARVTAPAGPEGG